ncbi:MAG: hypothetical protein LW834_22265 [Cyanobium sp. 49614_E6]|jgi:hypothetical protein|nr:hypothetical protein [Cyanobium sp. 49614_E6]
MSALRLFWFLLGFAIWLVTRLRPPRPPAQQPLHLRFANECRRREHRRRRIEAAQHQADDSFQ